MLGGLSADQHALGYLRLLLLRLGGLLRPSLATEEDEGA